MYKFKIIEYNDKSNKRIIADLDEATHGELLIDALSLDNERILLILSDNSGNGSALEKEIDKVVENL